jgi:hypothetical protein
MAVLNSTVHTGSNPVPAAANPSEVICPWSPSAGSESGVSNRACRFKLDSSPQGHSAVFLVFSLRWPFLIGLATLGGEA